MKTSTLATTCFSILALLTLFGCSTTSDKPTPEFNPKTCLEEVPDQVPGLQILQGPRTEANIAADMHPAYCNGQVLLKLMLEEGIAVNPGTVWFKVSVEYTGEVLSAEVVKSEIESPEFLKKVSDLIMDSDFTPWARHDDDAEFIYPMAFTHWWE